MLTIFSPTLFYLSSSKAISFFKMARAVETTATADSLFSHSLTNINKLTHVGQRFGG